MSLTFANPLALWALLGLPAVLAIHVFQRRTRRVRVTTLFLLEELTRESERGSVWDRLRSSWLLMAQLLAVLLLTWVLARPMWLRADSTQQAVLVLDSSVSMAAFLDEAREAVAKETARLGAAAARTEWTGLESDLTRPAWYRGTDRDGLLRAQSAWFPASPRHDPLPALRAARGLLRGAGVCVYVTDRNPEQLPAGVELLAVGQPFDNVGFSGARVASGAGPAAWSAVVANHGTQPQRRTWRVVADGGAASPPQALDLEPGGLRMLRGELPPGGACRLVLDGDRFALDDVAPLLEPRPKRLAARIRVSPPLQELTARIVASLPALDPATNRTPDVEFAIERSEHDAVVFLAPTPGAPPLLHGPVVADTDPLVDGLAWAGLTSRAGGALALTEQDRVLVWQGGRPLVAVRDAGGVRQLKFNFDVARSNADRLPAFVLCVSRFVESLRANHVGEEQANLESGQRVRVATDPAGPAPELRVAGQPAAPVAGAFRAPMPPGTLEVAQGGRTLLRAAVQFADAAEADFRAASSTNGVAARAAELVRANSREDFLRPVWTILLGLVVGTSWWLAERRKP